MTVSSSSPPPHPSARFPGQAEARPKLRRPSRTPSQRWIEVALSAISGTVLGAGVGFLGPILVAVAQGADPIHTGSYFEWISVLEIAIPILLVVCFVGLSWKDRWRRGLRACWLLAALFAASQAYLELR